MIEKFSSDVTFAGLTDPGRKRDHNEDSFALEAKLGLIFVADGMGGHEAGEVASGIAVSAVSDFVYECDPECIDYSVIENIDLTGEDLDNPEIKKSVAVIYSAIINANRRIYDENKERGFAEGHGMGTTIAGLWLLSNKIANKRKIIVFHVGDSRVYLKRNGVLSQVTKDHSLYQEWVKNGSIGEPPKTNIILRALGPYGEVEPSIAAIDLEKDDVFMICSDGLNDMVEDNEISNIISSVNHENLEQTAQRLINKANENGGKDNVTAVMLYYS